jgi:hypothetical protein
MSTVAEAKRKLAEAQEALKAAKTAEAAKAAGGNNPAPRGSAKDATAAAAAPAGDGALTGMLTAMMKQLAELQREVADIRAGKSAPPPATTKDPRDTSGGARTDHEKNKEESNGRRKPDKGNDARRDTRGGARSNKFRNVSGRDEARAARAERDRKPLMSVVASATDFSAVVAPNGNAYRWSDEGKLRRLRVDKPFGLQLWSITEASKKQRILEGGIWAPGRRGGDRFVFCAKQQGFVVKGKEQPASAPKSAPAPAKAAPQPAPQAAGRASAARQSSPRALNKSAAPAPAARQSAARQSSPRAQSKPSAPAPQAARANAARQSPPRAQSKPSAPAPATRPSAARGSPQRRPRESSASSPAPQPPRAARKQSPTPPSEQAPPPKSPTHRGRPVSPFSRGAAAAPRRESPTSVRSSPEQARNEPSQASLEAMVTPTRGLSWIKNRGSCIEWPTLAAIVAKVIYADAHVPPSDLWVTCPTVTAVDVARAAQSRFVAVPVAYSSHFVALLYSRETSSVTVVDSLPTYAIEDRDDAVAKALSALNLVHTSMTRKFDVVQSTSSNDCALYAADAIIAFAREMLPQHFANVPARVSGPGAPESPRQEFAQWLAAMGLSFSDEHSAALHRNGMLLPGFSRHQPSDSVQLKSNVNGLAARVAQMQAKAKGHAAEMKTRVAASLQAKFALLQSCAEALAESSHAAKDALFNKSEALVAAQRPVSARFADGFANIVQLHRATADGAFEAASQVATVQRTAMSRAVASLDGKFKQLQTSAEALVASCTGTKEVLFSASSASVVAQRPRASAQDVGRFAAMEQLHRFAVEAVYEVAAQERRRAHAHALQAQAAFVATALKSHALVSEMALQAYAALGRETRAAVCELIGRSTTSQLAHDSLRGQLAQVTKSRDEYLASCQKLNLSVAEMKGQLEVAKAETASGAARITALQNELQSERSNAAANHNFAAGLQQQLAMVRTAAFAAVPQQAFAPPPTTSVTQQQELLELRSAVTNLTAERNAAQTKVGTLTHELEVLRATATSLETRVQVLTSQLEEQRAAAQSANGDRDAEARQHASELTQLREQYARALAEIRRLEGELNDAQTHLRTQADIAATTAQQGAHSAFVQAEAQAETRLVAERAQYEQRITELNAQLATVRAHADAKDGMVVALRDSLDALTATSSAMLMDLNQQQDEHVQRLACVLNQTRQQVRATAAKSACNAAIVEDAAAAAGRLPVERAMAATVTADTLRMLGVSPDPDSVNKVLDSMQYVFDYMLRQTENQSSDFEWQVRYFTHLTEFLRGHIERFSGMTHEEQIAARMWLFRLFQPLVSDWRALYTTHPETSFRQRAASVAAAFEQSARELGFHPTRFISPQGVPKILQCSIAAPELSSDRRIVLYRGPDF